MDDKYFFDKREMKKAFKKYGLIFLFAIPVLIIVNYFLNPLLKNIWLVVLIDVVIVFAIMLIAQVIINAVKRYELEHPKQEKIKKKNKSKDEIIVEAEIVEANDKKNKKNKKTTKVVNNEEE